MCAWKTLWPNLLGAIWTSFREAETSPRWGTCVWVGCVCACRWNEAGSLLLLLRCLSTASCCSGVVETFDGVVQLIVLGDDAVWMCVYCTVFGFVVCSSSAAGVLDSCLAVCDAWW